MKKILSFLKDYKKETVLAPLFKMLEAIFELIVPLVMAAMIDSGIGMDDRGFVLRMGGVLIGLGLVGLTCSITAQYFAARAAVGAATQLRHAVFTHILALSYSKQDEVGSATLITRMTSDINQVQSGINMVLRLFLRSPFIVLGSMVMAFTIDWKAAMLFVVTIPLLSLVVFGIMSISLPLYRKLQEGLDGLLKHVRENLIGVRVIRAFHREEAEISEFMTKNQMLNEFQQYVGKISGFMNPLTYVIINLATLALIWMGALRVENGFITQGQVVALVNYMSQILVELIKLANLIVTITKAVACGRRVADVLQLEEGMTGEQNLQVKEKCKDLNNKIKIEFLDVSMSYHKEPAIQHIQFVIKPGETVGVIGGTGSGKTTLINLIPRFYDVSEGCVKVDGKDVRAYDVKSLREKTGMVPQKAVLFQGTIRDNLKWGNEQATDEQLYEALTIAQAMDIMKSKKDGLDEWIEQGGRNLSGGQRQRLTLARALVRKPEILILDDSSSALDQATDANLRKALQNLDYQPTILIVSQRTVSVQSADRILVMEDGALVGNGTHAQLLANCEVYQEIYASQFRGQEVSA